MNSKVATASVLALDGSVPGNRDLLGGKAYSVNKMRALGLPVPPAFALPTPQCASYYENGRALSPELWDEVVANIAVLEHATGRTFGRGPSPLLVSVRSGAAQSMPGMMDTVLNLGLNPELVEILAAESGNARWADDTWKRFCRAYADTVVVKESATPPSDPWEQLRAAIGAVFESWTNERVRAYRSRHNLGDGAGTAVTVQAMVFGNRDDSSATGVMFSRDPSTGEPVLYGEWLPRAQGEDVVSGEVTPQPLSTLAEQAPDLYRELEVVAGLLEREHRDLVDIEFTIESGRLYILQSRSGKRSGSAAVRIAADLVEEAVITPADAVSRVTPDQMRAALEATGIEGPHQVVARGLGAGPGIASGLAVTDPDEAVRLAQSGEAFVLVRPSTAPEDVPLMFDAVAVVTESGGATSHAALVCREIALPCVVGAGAGVVAALVGSVITVDGGAGVVYAGAHRASVTRTNPYVAAIVAMADPADPNGAALIAAARK